MLTLCDRVKAKVAVPEWGGTFYIHTLAPADMKAICKLQHGPDAMERLIVLSLYDDDGKRLFTERDIPALRQKSFQVMARLAGEIVALNNGFIDQVRYKAGLDKGRPQ